MNIGPMASGAIPPESLDRLHGLADWMDGHADSILGTVASPFSGMSFRATRSAGGERINVFLPAWPTSRDLLLPGLMTLPTQATMLGSPSREALPVRRVDAGVVVTLPSAPSNATCSVLRVEARHPLIVRA